MTNKLSWVGNFFQWLDDNVLSKTTRLWMYILESLGAIIIIIFTVHFVTGLNMVKAAGTELDLTKAQLYIKSIESLAVPIGTLVATICGAIPTLMGVFRSYNKKWQNGHEAAIANLRR